MYLENLIMKSIIKWPALASFMSMLFFSCTPKENVSFYPIVSSNTIGCDASLEEFISQQKDKFNHRYKFYASQKEAFAIFDQFTHQLEDDIKDQKFTIYGNTAITCVLSLNEKVVKETPLSVTQNTKDTVYFLATITQQDLSGNSQAFINQYAKFLTTAGFATDYQGTYLFYKEFATYQAAIEYFNHMNQHGELDALKTHQFCRNLSGNGFEYTGTVTIQYTIADGKEGPIGIPTNTFTTIPCSSSKTSYKNQQFYTGKVNVSITK